MRQSMLKRLNAARKSEGGFTLIELLIVIVILGVLAGIVVFSVQAIQSRGERAACRSEVKTVEVAVEAYYAQEKKYPQGADDAARIQVLLTDHYLKSLPTQGMTLNATTGLVAASPACPA